MTKNKGHTHPITWIICGLAVIFVTGYFGFQIYQNFQQQKVEAEQIIKAQQEKEKLLLQNQLEQQALDAKSQGATLEELKQQVVDLKNRPPEVKTETKTIIKEIPQEILKNNDSDYSAIIAEWQDRVAKVICDWTYSNGTIYKTGQGSGLLQQYKDIGTALVTNKHVIVDENGYGASRCRIGIYGNGSRLIGNIGGKSPFFVDSKRDLATIDIGSEYSLPDDAGDTYGNFEKAALQSPKVCKTQVNIGDKVIVLGYPAIGTQEGITATDGIISGFEGDYYVTSAKIDHGNSGGAAILLKDNCYLGIPTWALNLGGFESLGRILKSSFVFGE